MTTELFRGSETKHPTTISSAKGEINTARLEEVNVIDRGFYLELKYPLDYILDLKMTNNKSSDVTVQANPEGITSRIYGGCYIVFHFNFTKVGTIHFTPSGQVSHKLDTYSH